MNPTTVPTPVSELYNTAKAINDLGFVIGGILTFALAVAFLFFRVALLERNSRKDEVQKEKLVAEVEKDFKGISMKVENVKTELQGELKTQNANAQQNHLQVIEKIAELRGFKWGQEASKNP